MYNNFFLKDKTAYDIRNDLQILLFQLTSPISYNNKNPNSKREDTYDLVDYYIWKRKMSHHNIVTRWQKPGTECTIDYRSRYFYFFVWKNQIRLPARKINFILDH